MKKPAILFFAVFLSIAGFAQNVQEGVSHFYAERYQSAKSVFEKITAANPNNMEATYWLGQTLIVTDDLDGARRVYEKALAANGKAPLILAGMGHIHLLEGRTGEGRQRFDEAIAFSKGRKGFDPIVLNAVGRANVHAYTDQKKYGDLDYAITKLNEAAQIAPNNPQIFLNLGNAYRKKHRGGDAVQAYRKAGNYAPAMYRTAMIYYTQTQYGQGNWEAVLENLNNAIAADNNFAPAYEQLYYYYLRYKQDFATAEDFANKYIASSDPSVDNDYLKAQTLFVQDKFPEAIRIGKNIIAQTNNNPRSRVYRLLAYSYMGDGDTATACQYSELFFNKAGEEDVIAKDYILYAQTCGRNNPEIIRQSVAKAVEMESELATRIAMLNESINIAREAQQKVLEGELRLMSYQLRGENAYTDELISYIAVPFYLGGEFRKADSISRVYAMLAPDSIHGFYWSALALSRIDSTMEKGLAIPQFEKALEIALTDKVRFKSQGLQSASTLAAYYNNIRKQRDTAISYLHKGLEFDPDNANLRNFLSILQGSGAPKASGREVKVKTDDGQTKVKVKE